MGTSSKNNAKDGFQVMCMEEYVVSLQEAFCLPRRQRHLVPLPPGHTMIQAMTWKAGLQAALMIIITTGQTAHQLVHRGPFYQASPFLIPRSESLHHRSKSDFRRLDVFMSKIPVLVNFHDVS